MEIDVLIITGTVFTLSIILAGAFIIVSAQRKKAKILLELRELELKRQKDISENTLQSQENERQKIGMELHDELGPSFAAIRLDISRMQQKIESNELDEVQDIAQKTSSDLKHAINQFSDVSRILYPVIFKRHGLKAAVTDIIDRYNHNSSIKFTFDYNLQAEHKEIVALVLYRICQELTTNAMKHSNANHVTISLYEKNKHILLDYKDDGIGFNTNLDYKGLGLNSIKGRVNAVDGNIHFSSIINEGLELTLSIPYD